MMCELFIVYWPADSDATLVVFFRSERSLEFESSEKTGSLKRLGDKQYTPASQSVGTIFNAIGSEDWGAFVFLARNYKMEGADRLTLCELNAEVSCKLHFPARYNF